MPSSIMNTTNNSRTDHLRRRRNQTNKTNRQHLFQSTPKDNHKSSKNDLKTNKNNEESKAINLSLNRTKQMMRSELQRVSDVTSAIQDDGKRIQSIKGEHISMGDGVKGAKYALGWLKLKEKEDVIIFWSSVVFFYIVVLYVMWTRVRIPFLLW
jgi:hypothetical protein